MATVKDDILSLLIVEDEQPIRDQLSLLPWESSGVLLVGAVSGAAEALEFCSDFMPDIIVTDILMPGMDGLALIRAMREKNSRIQFIILTCLEDFAHAREALALGAVAYLVKVSLGQSEIRAALDRARHNLDSIDATARTSRRDRYWEWSNQVRRALEGDDLPPDVPIPAVLLVVHVIAERTDFLFVNRSVLDTIDRRPERWFDGEFGRYAIIADWGDGDEQPWRDTLHSAMEEIAARKEADLSWLGGECRIFATASSRINSPEDLREAWGQLRRWRDISFYDERQTYFSGTPEPLRELSENERDQMDLMARRYELSVKRIVEFLRNEFIVEARRRRYRADQLKMVAISWRQRWCRMFGLKGAEEPFLMRVSGLACLSDLAALLRHELGGDEEETDRPLRPEIAKAARIIREEYGKPLSLTSVAERVGLSAPYLSRLFKEQEGRTFHHYLTDVRVGAAADLLRDTNLKVYEIAERVGLPSYRYFSAVFKGNTGRTPRDFQRGADHEAQE